MSKLQIKKVTVLGATGSVGCTTLDILRDQRAMAGRDSVQVIALTANQNWKKLAEQALEFAPEYVALADAEFADDLRDALCGSKIEVGCGPQSLLTAAAMDANWVMAAITGAAGLPSILVAAKRGCILALANKESLICSGALLKNTCAQNGTTLLPVDSEHNAIFQVFNPAMKSMVERVILTASGGPFRQWSAKDIANATPKQAIAHPVWSMGAKISVDSASLMNKGLELIEARHLFDVSPDQLEVLVHPQSVVHGLVEYKDGSMLAQLGPPDMRVPIASAWGWPARIQTNGKKLSLSDIGRLDFEEPDIDRFPALKLARNAMNTGGNACNALSAANEIAVASFLQGQIGFSKICEVVEFVIESGDDSGSNWSGEPGGFEQVFDIDHRARLAAQTKIQAL
ncbi:1-deoxy-D-xylulose 5-phosphate reductoisomerase [hydrothermal vent metagenome]|uniref:1-deoxy-D-xylulose-5-phosphate reductoisomerase n=1 Tax=hydrothermal vent metagenome TaxID=652676 RepID=A0A3B0RK28_9ZZZZ